MPLPTNYATGQQVGAADIDAITTQVNANTAALSTLGLTPTGIKTANYTAVANDLVVVDATSGNVTVTLPSAPADKVIVAAKRNDNSANTVTIVTSGTDTFNIASGSTSQTFPFMNYLVQFQYQASTGIWYQIVNAMPIGQLDLRYVTPTGTYTMSAKTMDAGSNTFTGFAWCPEAVIASTTLVTGYNDVPGGFAVEPGPNANGVYLDAVWIRLGTIGATVATSSCQFDVYGGTATTQGTLIVSVVLNVGDNNQIATLGTPYALSANAVVRVYCSTAGGVTTPIHCQLRGRYHG